METLQSKVMRDILGAVKGSSSDKLRKYLECQRVKPPGCGTLPDCPGRLPNISSVEAVSISHGDHSGQDRVNGQNQMDQKNGGSRERWLCRHIFRSVSKNPPFRNSNPPRKHEQRLPSPKLQLARKLTPHISE